MSVKPRRSLLLLAVGAALLFCTFIGLGTWQVQRLGWKLALIEQVEQRAHGAPVAAPEAARWGQVSAASDAYRHVRVRGALLYPLSAYVQATTELGSGFWLLTPLCTDDGSVVFINRGFVQRKATRPTPISHQSACRPGATGAMVTIDGLLRISEPGGGFLRQNDAGADRWHSRDVAAIGAARALQRVAPYFIDAEAGQQAAQARAPGADGERPVGGLTVIAFQNNHVVYALTWYALALMVAGATWWVARDARRKAIMPSSEDAT